MKAVKKLHTNADLAESDLENVLIIKNEYLLAKIGVDTTEKEPDGEV